MPKLRLLFLIGVAALAVQLTGCVPPPAPVARPAAPPDVEQDLWNLEIALRSYHNAHGTYPASASFAADGKPLLSWRVHILPYIDAQLYQQFKLDEPWDSAHNQGLIEKMPEVYRNSAVAPQEKYATTYLAPIGEHTILRPQGGVGVGEIKDGQSNTILLLEVAPAQAVVWTKPEDWEVDEKDLLRGLPVQSSTGAHVLLADGTRATLLPNPDRDAFRGFLHTRDGMMLNSQKVFSHLNFAKQSR